MIHRLIARIIPFLPKKIVWLFSKKYIAGESLEDAIKTIKDLDGMHISSSIDLLGESIDTRDQAMNYVKQYLHSIEQIRKTNLYATYSLKPTMFGLLWDEDFCYTCIKKIVKCAQQWNYFIRIDMEDSQCTSKEILLFERLYKEFPDNVGLVFQACLKRTISDLSYIHQISIPDHRPNIRLCKGIYRETVDIAFQKKQEIRDNFMLCLKFMLDKKFFAAIATHDNVLINKSIGLLKQNKKNRSDYEFQMLLGVCPNLRAELVNQGHPMRIYVPFGEQWFQYSTRRLLENPRMIRDILLALFLKR
jgi:proline dehydrogenase